MFGSFRKNVITKLLDKQEPSHIHKKRAKVEVEPCLVLPRVVPLEFVGRYELAKRCIESWLKVRRLAHGNASGKGRGGMERGGSLPAAG